MQCSNTNYFIRCSAVFILIIALISHDTKAETSNTRWLNLINKQQHYHDKGEYGKAIKAGTKALAIARSHFGAEDLNTALSLNNIALNYNAVGKYNEALTLQKNAYKIFKAKLPPNHPDIATSLNNISLTYLHKGEYKKAIEVQQQALLIREISLGENHKDTATVLNNLASSYIFLGDYEKALPLQLRSLEIRKNNPQDNPLGTANALNNLARTYQEIGQLDMAMESDKLALEIVEEKLGINHPRTARSLNNLAVILRLMNREDDALEYENKSLLIRESILGPNHIETADSLENLAQLSLAKSNYSQAIDFQMRAIEIKKNVLGFDHPRTLVSLNNLSGMYFDSKRYSDAIQVLHSILNGIETSLGSTHPTTATILGNLAHAYATIENQELAIILYKRSINIFQSQRELVHRIGLSALKSYTDSISHVYKNLAALLIEHERLAEAIQILDMLKENEQFDFIQRSNNADPRRSRIGYTTSEEPWEVRYRQIADRLAALGAEKQMLQQQAKLGLTKKQKQRLQAVTNDLVVAHKAFESYLRELRNSFAKQGPARAVDVLETSQQALRETQALLIGLGNDTVLLHYYVTDDKVGILLTTPGVQLARSTAIKSTELNRQIIEFRRMLRDPKTNTLPAAEALYQVLLAPVEKDLIQAGAKNIMLSLDGSLRYLPFAALHDGKQYLVQRWNMPMYTSVTKSKLGDDVTPQWQAAGLGLTRAVGKFAALPAVKAEMSSIVKTGGSGVLPGEVYLDESFNATRLKDVSQRKFQLLHVASHFQFSPGTEINSFLLLGDGQQLTLGDIRTQNYRFDNVDLLTLSACDTGLGGGRDAQGREIEGFGVIAQQQGAKAVLATLWPVADQSTAVLMADMYKQRQEKSLTKVEALRQAQLSLLYQPKYSHPFYWAPFILMGNWK
jgi:CHAT domain-containing protein